MSLFIVLTPIHTGQKSDAPCVRLHVSTKSTSTS
jgi:hypothetical protein